MEQGIFLGPDAARQRHCKPGFFERVDRLPDEGVYQPAYRKAMLVRIGLAPALSPRWSVTPGADAGLRVAAQSTGRRGLQEPNLPRFL
jgi:hypothetical protein